MRTRNEIITEGLLEAVKTHRGIDGDVFEGWKQANQDRLGGMVKTVLDAQGEHKRPEILPPVLIVEDSSPSNLGKRQCRLYEVGYRCVGGITVHEEGTPGTIGHEVLYCQTVQIEA